MRWSEVSRGSGWVNQANQVNQVNQAFWEGVRHTKKRVNQVNHVNRAFWEGSGHTTQTLAHNLSFNSCFGEWGYMQLYAAICTYMQRQFPYMQKTVSLYALLLYSKNKLAYRVWGVAYRETAIAYRCL